MKLFRLLLCLPLVMTCVRAGLPQPKILVVLTDDLGYSDLGCCGSDIEVPTLDQLG